MASAAVSTSRSGIGAVGDVPWGTHFCQFYQSQQDLLDTLIPYFEAGLRNNGSRHSHWTPPRRRRRCGRRCRSLATASTAARFTLVAITGYGQEEDVRTAREAGFTTHLTKPVDPRRLEELLALVAAG